MKNKILKDFGKMVRLLRKKRGWTKDELADKAGLHRTYIGSIERSERNVSLINIDRIAKALDVTISELLGNKK